jgi:hypothetical protein
MTLQGWQSAVCASWLLQLNKTHWFQHCSGFGGVVVPSKMLIGETFHCVQKPTQNAKEDPMLLLRHHSKLKQTPCLSVDDVIGELLLNFSSDGRALLNRTFGITQTTYGLSD